MTTHSDPALAALAAHLSQPREWGQLTLSPQGGGWELRHSADAGAPVDGLRLIPAAGLAELAQLDEQGRFRPNKTAPNLRRGWVARVESPAELEAALRALYPGAIADWAAARGGLESGSLAEFLGRQTGMFRSLRGLSADSVRAVAAAGCGPSFCLRRRVWSMTGVDPEGREGKSDIPCYEPCGLLMEMLRRAAKAEREPAIPVALTREDWDAVSAALEARATLAAGEGREGELSEPANPRRARIAADRIQAQLPPAPPAPPAKG